MIIKNLIVTDKKNLMLQYHPDHCEIGDLLSTWFTQGPFLGLTKEVLGPKGQGPH